MAHGDDEYAEFRDQSPEPKGMDKVRVGILALLKAELEVAAAQSNLEAANRKRNELKFKDLPQLIKQELGNLTEFKIELPGGYKYKVKRDTKTYASLSEGNAQFVFDWMNKHGYAHHISNNLVIPFTKGQEQDLAKVEEHLKKFDGTVQYTNTPAIHPSTYTAFCAKLKKDGINVDDKMFGIHDVDQVKLSLIE